MRPPSPEPAPSGLSQHTMDYLAHLAATVDSKGGYFPGHSDSVAYLATMLGGELHLREPLMSWLHAAAMLHDVGKLLIPDEILNAPRELTPEEWTIMRRHPTWSAQVAAGISDLGPVAKWVLHHHEHWDGSGYPDGLKGEEIPWQSRLLLIADAFHVMTAHRPYREAMSRHSALVVINNCAGLDFDPEMVDTLLNRPYITHRRDRVVPG
jgi:HD-GYP domain-containing protein (c-di-GMP phosphodiesterase class II)